MPATWSQMRRAFERHKEGNWLTAEYGDFVLTLVSRRVGLHTLNPGQYRSEREAMLAGGRNRTRHGRQLTVPTDDQIAALAGSWDQALAHAGLHARQGAGARRTRSRPVGIAGVLDRCYEHHGTEPTVGELELFARSNGIPYPHKERGRPFSDYVREWKDGRRARGLPVPEAPPPKPQRPDYSQDVGAALPGERRAKKPWDDRDEVIDGATR